jgi:hypothetical protein
MPVYSIALLQSSLVLLLSRAYAASCQPGSALGTDQTARYLFDVGNGGVVQQRHVQLGFTFGTIAGERPYHAQRAGCTSAGA